MLLSLSGSLVLWSRLMCTFVLHCRDGGRGGQCTSASQDTFKNYLEGWGRGGEVEVFYCCSKFLNLCQGAAEKIDAGMLFMVLFFL